ncbi:MAG: lipopolysaccharide biosynthesis protein [Deltaproteobacteria bacterium]|nr:lipopolysaccharide biosynthesis protein [Deltaproteobacteria bacterium]
MKARTLLQKMIRPEEHSLKIRGIRAAAWSFLAKGVEHAFRMAGNLVLTRLLFPEAFGIMATALAVLTVIHLFSDTGVRTSIIQNPRGDEPEFLNTAWVISLCRAVLLSIAVALLAWPVSHYYNHPELKGILLVLALHPLILGLENPAFVLFIKRFRVEKQVLVDLGAQVLGLTASIVLAYLLRSVYALVASPLLSSLSRVAASYLLQPYRPRLEWNKKAFEELFHFGKYIFFNTIVSAAVMNSDVLMIGKMLDMETLGTYSIGRNIGLMVWLFCLQVFAQSYLPAVSTVAGDPARIRNIYRKTTALALAFAVPVSILLSLFSGDIIRMLYDSRYENASIALFWISASVIFRVISLANSNTFIGTGRPVYEILSMAVGLAALCLFIPLGARFRGLAGAAGGMFCGMVVVTAAESVFMVQGIKFPLKVALYPWIQALLLSFAMVGLFRFVRPWLAGGSFFNLPFLAIMGSAGLVLSLGVYVLFQGLHPFRDKAPKQWEGELSPS